MNTLVMEFEDTMEIEKPVSSINAYISDKVDFLKNGGFCIKLSKKELKRMFANCTTETAVDNVARSILMKYL